MKIPKLQTAFLPLTLRSDNTRVDNTRAQMSYQNNNRQVRLRKKLKLDSEKQAAARRMLSITVSADNRTDAKRRHDQKQAEVKTKQMRKEQEKAENLLRFEQVADAAIKLTRPSTYEGYVLTDHPFGEGFGNEAANIAGDLLAGPLAALTKTIGKQGFKYAWKAIPGKGNLVGYGTNPADTPLGFRHAADSGLYPDFSKMTRVEKIQYLKTQQELALRVDQARTMDALHLTQDRVRNGGYDRLVESMKDDLLGNNPEAATVVVLPEIRKIMLNKNRKNIFARPLKGTAKDFEKKTGDHQNANWGGIGGLDEYYGVYSDTPEQHILKRNLGNSHEYVHYLYWPLSRPKGISFLGKSGGYLSGTDMGLPVGSGEVAARGTQLKNYFGLKEGEQLTPEMWNYAARHYAADVADNNMTDLFLMVDTKSPDFSFFMKWLNKHVPAIGTGITVTGGAVKTINKDGQ